MIGIALGWAIAAGMTGLGIGAAVVPKRLSWIYGIPVYDPASSQWVRAAGFRDVGLAVILVATLLWGDDPVAAVTLLATAGIAVTDFAGVVGLRGLKPRGALAVHSSGVGGGVLAGALVWMGW